MKKQTTLRIILVILALSIIGLLLFTQPASAKPPAPPRIVAVAGEEGQIEINLTQEMIGMVAGALLSFVCSYLPVIGPAYNKLSEDWKRFVMLLLMAGVTAGTLYLGCTGVIGGVTCTQNGIVHAVLTFFFAAMSNQTTHNLSPRVGAKAKPAPADDPNMLAFHVQYPPVDEAK